MHKNRTPDRMHVVGHLFEGVFCFIKYNSKINFRFNEIYWLLCLVKLIKY